MKVKAIENEVGALGTVAKSLQKGLEGLKISAEINQNIQEIHGDLLALRHY